MVYYSILYRKTLQYLLQYTIVYFVPKHYSNYYSITIVYFVQNTTVFTTVHHSIRHGPILQNYTKLGGLNCITILNFIFRISHCMMNCYKLRVKNFSQAAKHSDIHIFYESHLHFRNLDILLTFCKKIR